MKPRFPKSCPSCDSLLEVTQLTCSNCKTTIAGNFVLPILTQLTEEEQEFILQFFISSGSLKEMAVQLGNSYPTVRNKLDDMIEKIKRLKS